jgi:hypothetical protein
MLVPAVTSLARPLLPRSAFSTVKVGMPADAAGPGARAAPAPALGSWPRDIAAHGVQRLLGHHAPSNLPVQKDASAFL